MEGNEGNEHSLPELCVWHSDTDAVGKYGFTKYLLFSSYWNTELEEVLKSSCTVIASWYNEQYKWVLVFLHVETPVREHLFLIFTFVYFMSCTEFRMYLSILECPLDFVPQS